MNENYPNSDRLTIEEWRVIENARNLVASERGESRLPSDTALENLSKAVDALDD